MILLLNGSSYCQNIRAGVTGANDIYRDIVPDSSLYAQAVQFSTITGQPGFILCHRSRYAELRGYDLLIHRI